MNKNWTGPVTLVAAGILTIAGTIISRNWELIEVNPNLNNVSGDIFIKYLFIIVAAERAIAVFISIQFDEKKKKLINAIDTWNAKLTKARKLEADSKDVEAEYGNDQDPAFQERKLIGEEKVVVRLLNLRENALNALASLQQRSHKTAMAILLCIGILLAIAGLSIMQDLIITHDAWGEEQYKLQRTIFRFLDILITGALIGGGSKSFHQFLSTLQAVLDRVKSPSKPESSS